MKRLKIFSAVLAAAVLMSACSAKTEETTTAAETSAATEETTEATETTTEATTTETTETEPSAAEALFDTSFDSVEITDFISVSKEEGSNDYIPHFTIEDEAFGEANKKITEFCEDFKTRDFYNSEGCAIRFAIIDVSSREFSLVIYTISDYDFNEYLAFTVDKTSSEILTNDDILALGGEPSSELFEDAEFSITAILNERCGGSTEELEHSSIDECITSEKINKSMLMFLGHDYRLFLGSDIPSFGGASSYFEIYDLDGNGYSYGSLYVTDIADYFFLDLRDDDSYEDLVLAKKTGNEIELYGIVDGKLQAIDKIEINGTIDKYSSFLTITGDDGSSVTYSIDDDGKIVSGNA